MIFEKDYYVRSKISNYEDYRKKKFEKIARELIKDLKLDMNSRILDFGAATGGLLSSLVDLGVPNVIGTDISYWAINFGRKKYNLSKHQLQHYNRQLLEEEFSCIFMLDVLEHIHLEEINNILALIKSPSILVRIPVCGKEGEDFVLEESRFDKTHIQCHEKQWWIKLFAEYGYELERTLNLPTIFDSEGVFVGKFSRK